MTVRVTTNPVAVDRLLNEAGARRLVADTAQQIAEDASSLASVDDGFLRRSYKATRARMTKTGLVATAYTDSAIGHIEEWGSVKRAPRATLRRAAARTGLRRREYPKGAQP